MTVYDQVNKQGDEWILIKDLTSYNCNVLSVTTMFNM